VCVAGFDHHCDFLGKCVGSGNVRAFLLMLWAFVAASAGGLAYTASAAAVTVARAAAAGADFGAERDLWAAAGGLFGLAAAAAACLPGPRSVSGALVRALFIGGAAAAGAAAVLAAFARAAGAAAATAAAPALLATPLFLYLLGLVASLASTFSCTFAARRTTKAELAARHAGSAADGTAGAAGASGAAQRSAVPPTPFAERLANFARLLATPAPRRMVDFTADVSELAAAVRAVEKAAFLRAVAASQRPDAAPLPGAESAKMAVADWRCLEALRASVDSNYVEDAVAVGEGVGGCRPVAGVLVGSSLLLPGVVLSPAPPPPF
jgi:hypothetical protein